MAKGIASHRQHSDIVSDRKVALCPCALNTKDARDSPGSCWTKTYFVLHTAGKKPAMVHIQLSLFRAAWPGTPPAQCHEPHSVEPVHEPRSNWNSSPTPLFKRQSEQHGRTISHQDTKKKGCVTSLENWNANGEKTHVPLA